MNRTTAAAVSRPSGKSKAKAKAKANRAAGAEPGRGDESTPPGAGELARLLGASHAAFLALTRLRTGLTCEWKRYSRTAPWVLKVSRRDRTLLYATPKADAFEATVVLGERATAAALGGRVPKALHASIRAARPYAEGRPVRVLVRRRADLASVEELVAVKLDPAGNDARPPSAGRRGRTTSRR